MLAAEVLPDEVTFNAAISACEKGQVISGQGRCDSSDENIRADPNIMDS